MSPRGEIDAIVVGLGAMGAAVTLRLARHGLRVVGLDRFRPPHAHGSTHGETRITRLAIGEGAEYVPLVRRSHELWRDLESETGVRLFHQVGGVVLAGRDNTFLHATRAAAAAFGIAHENLSNAELRRRFPMFGVDGATEGYFEPDAGFVRPEAAVQVQLALARAAGAELRVGDTVFAWDSASGGVTVTTTVDRLTARELVICAGAWVTQLWPQASSLIAIHRQLVHWFPIRRGYRALREMPVFVWELEGEKAEFAHGLGFYGFPAIDGREGGVKLATETYEATVEPDARSAADAPRWAYARYFPWVGTTPLRTIPCLYTNTRGSRFIIDRHPDHRNVTIVSACSGHGFKHSPAIGEAVAEWIVEGRSRLDLGPFAIENHVRTP